ncbi:hypothetical protein EDB19DRAFT_2029832 [Suillus lakei]|nr:hypothetical protein EDB19DRAFT_2029832 [Suillus lakei]
MAAAYPIDCIAEPCLPLKLPVIPDLGRTLPEGEDLPEEESLPNEEPLPEVLRAIMMKLLCLFALWRPDLQEHWNSLQSDEAFGSVRTILCSILSMTIILASTLIGLSNDFKVTSSVNYVDYTSEPAFYLVFIATLMFAIIAMVTSGLSTISWLYTDRHRAQKFQQLEQGGFCVVFYLLSVVAHMFFIALSLMCFICALDIASSFSLSSP